MASRKRPETKPESSPETQLAGFLAKFTPEVAKKAEEILRRMRARLPGAIELVYDNYNALAIGFGPNDRTSDCVFSIAVYPRWVSLFFFYATELPDPEELLKGAGNMVRHIVLTEPAVLDSSGVRNLMTHALEAADPAIDPKGKRRMIIKSVSEKQRPRRPKK